MQGNDGNFYGTTLYGGANDWGTVFKLTPGGVLTTLVEFTGTSGSNIGEYPYAGWYRAAMGTSTGRPLGAARTVGARSSS